jgi:hypothetical protein
MGNQGCCAFKIEKSEEELRIYDETKNSKTTGPKWRLKK